MASLNNHPLQFLIILFATLLLFFKPTHLLAQKTTTTNNNNDIVTSTCSHTPDPKTCESELRSDPRSSTAKDIQTLILIMIDVVKKRFSESVQIAKDLTRTTHDPNTTRALKNCISVYRLVIDHSVVSAITAVKQGNPKFAEMAMVDAGTEVEACLIGFPGGKVPVQLAGHARILHGDSNVAVALIKIME